MELVQVIIKDAVQVNGTPLVEVVEVAQQGPAGASGIDPDAVLVSADAGNRLTRGTDSGLYVSDDLMPDPLAYYILAKS